jgi:predicted secreted Zn-dependent protease
MPNSNNKSPRRNGEMVDLVDEIDSDLVKALGAFAEEYGVANDVDIVKMAVGFVYVAADAIALMASNDKQSSACELSHAFAKLLHGLTHFHEDRHKEIAATEATEKFMKKIFSSKDK